MKQSIRNFSDAIFEPAEAFAGVAFAAIASDREIKEIERFAMQAIFARMRLFNGWTAARYAALFDRLYSDLAQYGVTGLLDMSVAGLPPELYQPAFAVSIDLVLADGIVRDEEEGFLYTLQHALRIDPALASQILRVITIKNLC